MSTPTVPGYLRQASDQLTKLLETDRTTKQLSAPQLTEIQTLIADIPKALPPAGAATPSPIVGIHLSLVQLGARVRAEWIRRDVESARLAIAEAARLSGVDLSEPDSPERSPAP